MKSCMAGPQKLKIEVLYDPAIAVLGIHPKELKSVLKRYLCTHAQSTITKTAKSGTTQVFLG